MSGGEGSDDWSGIDPSCWSSRTRQEYDACGRLACDPGDVRMLPDPGADRLGTPEADHAVDQLAAPKHAEGRDPHDPVADGDLLVLVRVELADLDLARELGRELLDDGLHHLARRTPVRVEIDHHGLRGQEHFGLEGPGVEL